MKKLPFQRFFLLCGLLMAGSEIWKQLYLTCFIHPGVYDWWYFPFQLCSTPMYVLLVLPHLKKGRLREVLLCYLMCYGLLGGIAAFADTSGMHYASSLLTAHSYLWHLLLILIGVLSGIAYLREYAPNIRSFLGSTLLYLSFCLIAAGINHRCNPLGTINMFYINPHYRMNQIGFTLLVPYIGNRAAIAVYMGMTVIGGRVLFCLFRWLGKRGIFIATRVN